MTEESTKSVGSDLDVAGNLSLSTGRDTNFIGSRADITGNADVNTGGNFNLINDYDTYYAKVNHSSKGTLSSSRTSVELSSSTVVHSVFNTGGDLNVDSSNDINIVGSELNTEGNASVNADGSINIVAVHDESYVSIERTKSGLGTGGAVWGSEKKSDSVYDKLVNSSVVDIKGKYASNSGGDTNIIGSTLNVGEEADITTGGDLNIVAAYNEHTEEHKVEEGGFLSMNGNLFSMEKDSMGRNSRTVGAPVTGGQSGSLSNQGNITDNIDKMGVSGLAGASGIDSYASGASVINAGKLTINSGNDLYIEGSEINAGSAEITTEGSFIETSAKETSSEYSKHEETNLTTASMTKMFGPESMKAVLAWITGGASSKVVKSDTVKVEDGRLSVYVASGKYEKSESETISITQKSSELNISDGLIINSGKDIIIAGSDINNDGDTTLSAAGDVRIETTDEGTVTSSKEKKGTAELTVGATHMSIKLAYATKAVYDATVNLKKAKDDYDEYKKSKNKAANDLALGLIDQEEYDDITDLKIEAMYIAAIALATTEVAAKTAALAQTVIAAGSSIKTWGFDGDAQLDIDVMQTNSYSLVTTSKGSNINTGGNLIIKADNNALIKGSDISAGQDISIEAKNVDIIAAQNTEESSKDSKNAHLNFTFSVSGGPSGSASAGKSGNESDSISYTNSHLNASNITIKSANDTTVSGGVVAAEKALTLDVGGDLTVESLQDRSSDRSYSIGISGGISGDSSGSSVSKANIGVNASMSKSSKKWVDEQTSLTGGGTVDIYVEDKTTLTGALIASDTGDLTLDTGSFEYSNIKDRERSINFGGGISLLNYGDKPAEKGSTGSGGSSTSNGNNGTTEEVLNSSKKTEKEFSGPGLSSVSLGFSDNRQTNFATVGAGTITVRDTSTGSVTSKGLATGLEGLNRDVSLSQYGTMSTGVQLSADQAMINVLTSPGETFHDIATGATILGNTAVEVGRQTSVIVEKTGNLIDVGVFGLNGDRDVKIAKLEEQCENLGINLEGKHVYELSGLTVEGEDGKLYKVDQNGVTFVGERQALATREEVEIAIQRGNLSIEEANNLREAYGFGEDGNKSDIVKQTSGKNEADAISYQNGLQMFRDGEKYTSQLLFDEVMSKPNSSELKQILINGGDTDDIEIFRNDFYDGYLKEGVGNTDYKDFTPETIKAINADREKCWNSFYSSLFVSGGNPVTALVNIGLNPDTYRVVGTGDNGIKYNNFHIKNEIDDGKTVLSGHYDTNDVTTGNYYTIYKHLIDEWYPSYLEKRKQSTNGNR